MGECLGNRQTQTQFVQWCYCLDWVWNNSSAHRRLPWAQAWSTAVCCVVLCWIALCQMSGKHLHTPWVKHYVSDMARHWTFDRFHNRLRTSCLFCVIITYLWGTSSYQREQRNSVYLLHMLPFQFLILLRFVRAAWFVLKQWFRSCITLSQMQCEITLN